MRIRSLKFGAVMAIALSWGAVAQAAVIVDFKHRDGPETDKNSKPPIYAGVKANWNNKAATENPNLALRKSTDLLQLPVNVGTSDEGLKGMLVWDKVDFLDHSGETVVFDATSSMSLMPGGVVGSATLRFVVKSGGIYYVSNTSVSGAMSIAPTADTWAPLYTDDYSIGMFAPRTFSDIQGVGIYLHLTPSTAKGQVVLQIKDFLVSAATPTVFLVDNYGATPDDDSDNDESSIKRCINAARSHANSSGPAVVRFSPGTYHLSGQQQIFTLSNKTGPECLIIDGNGCTLMNTHEAPLGLSFQIVNSNNVTVRNMTIRSEKCMWVEGEIVAVNGDGTYDVQLRSDSPAFNAWGTIDQGREDDSYGFAWPCARGLYSAPPIGGKRSSVFVKTAEPVPGIDGRWKVTSFGDGVTGVGDTYAMWNDWTHWVHEDALGRPTDYQSFFVRSSSNVELRDITLMTGSKMAVRATESSNIVIHRFKTLPDAGRAVAMARDGFNLNDCTNVLVRGCIVGFNGDDAVNASGGDLAGSNMIFEDNLFCFSRRFAMLNLSDNSIFRNNISYYNGGSMIFGEHERAARNLLIADNETYSSNRNDFFRSEVYFDKHSDVTVINNRFFECEYPLLFARETDNFSFEYNHLDRGSRETDQYIATLGNVPNANLVGNTTATADVAIQLNGATTLTAGSQTAFGQDTEPEFDQARVFAKLGFTVEVPEPPTSVVLDLERLSTLNAAPYFTGGLNAAVWTASNVSPTTTLSYDISGAGLGGVADTLEIQVTSLNGENLTTGGGNGISVQGGTRNAWWDVGENLNIAITLKQGATDVTADYNIALSGVGLRKNTGEAALIASQAIAAGAPSGAFAFSGAVDLGATSNQFTAERTATAGSYAQFSQVRLEVVSIPVPAPVIP